MGILILLRGHVVECVCGALFVEELSVISDPLPRVSILCHVQIDKELCLDLSVDCLHRSVIGWCSSSRHGTFDVVRREQFVELL